MRSDAAPINLIQRVNEWNATRLDLFKISEPNKRNEFYGVIRFFFQGDDLKYQSKCVRVANTSTACQLVNTLVEKFHPDLKLLTAGRYALYEYTYTKGERRLGADEVPLLIQLNWAFEEEEIRFILRDESKPVLTARQQQKAMENQPGALQTVKQRPDAKLSDNGDNRTFPRRWTSGSRKKKGNKSENESPDEPQAIPDSTFTRTLSNPDEVLRRRRERKMHERVQEVMADREKSNLVKIHGESLNPEKPYIVLDLHDEDSAEQVVKWTLDKYGLSNQLNPQDFCIVQCNLPPRGQRLPAEVEREYTLHNSDSVFGLRIKMDSIHRGTNYQCIFQIRHRRAMGKDGRRPPPAPSKHPRVPCNPSSSQYKSSEPPSVSHEYEPCLIEVRSLDDCTFKPDGMCIPMGDLFNRRITAPIKLGSIQKIVGGAPNVLVDKQVHPDIRPVHCTFSVVLANMAGSKQQQQQQPPRIPKAGPPNVLVGMTQFSLLLTPSMDGFAKPPGPAQVRVDGIKITGPMLITYGATIQLGKSLILKFVNLNSSLSEPNRLDTTLPRRMNNALQSGGGSRSATPNGLGDNVDSLHEDLSRSSQPEPFIDLLPLTIELPGNLRPGRTNILDRYIHLVDQVLNAAQSDIDVLTNQRAKDANRPSVFSLSPAYALYLVYRACQKHVSGLNEFDTSDVVHHISYIVNHIATRVFESLPPVNRTSDDIFSVLTEFIYWLANSSELLQFFKNDVDLITPTASKSPPPSASMRPQSPVHLCQQGLNSLADAIDQCFYELQSCVRKLFHPLLFALICPSDSDLNEDLRQDDRPVIADAYKTKSHEVPKMHTLMQLLSLIMLQLRRNRVNASLTIQLFAHIFHLFNAHIFNNALVQANAKPRHAREETNVWLTHIGANRVIRRLDRIKQWAHRHGLERAAECRLQRSVQACELVLADRSGLNDFYQLCMNLLALNSVQLEWLLAHFGDPPQVPDDWIDLIVTGGKEVNDRAIIDEMDQYDFDPMNKPTSSLELQLSEINELQLPLLLPHDGYASDAILTGTPSGLTEFLRPFVTGGLIQLKRNPSVTGQANARPWANYLAINKEGSLLNSEQRQPETVTKKSNRHSFHLEDKTESDLTGSSSDVQRQRRPANSKQSHPTSRHPNSGAFRSASQDKPKYKSLPDLNASPFDSLAEKAHVSKECIERFYLRKYKNSLGLSIVAAKAQGHNHYGIYVKEIVTGGAADRDGRLETGDQILTIGSTNLIGCAQSDAVAAIAKQSSAEDGLLLTIAKGAARQHGILELIRPLQKNQPNRSAPDLQTPVPRTKSQPDIYQDPVDPLLNAPKPGSAVDPPLYRIGLSQPNRATQPSQTGVRGRGPKQLKPDHRSITEGQLSRSTPTLNLVEVGRKCDDEETEPALGRTTRRLSNPEAQQKGNKPTTLQSATRRHQNEMSSDSDLSSSSASVNDPNIPHPDTVEKSRPIQVKNGGGKDGPKSQDFHSQPDMRRYKPDSVNRNHQKPSSTTNIPHDEKIISDMGQDSVTDALSSLESVSSAHTPFSLDGSAGLEEKDPTVLERKSSTKTHVRHLPPPSVPVQNRNGSRIKSENEVVLQRPSSVTDMKYGEKSVRTRPHGMLPEPARREVDSSSIKRMSESEHSSTNEQLSTVKSANRMFEQVPEEVDFSDNELEKPQLNSHSPTMIVKNGHRPTPVTTPMESVEPTSSEPTNRPVVSKKPTITTKPLTDVDDSPSETLKPPTHAVVSSPRWVDTNSPNFVQESIPDLPVYHSDPQRGRPRQNSLDNRPSTFDRLDDHRSMIHVAEFKPGTKTQDEQSSTRLNVPVSKGHSINRWNPPDHSQRLAASPIISRVPSDIPPPPIPTADCPQYHPPDRLEPVDWTTYVTPDTKKSPFDGQAPNWPVTEPAAKPTYIPITSHFTSKPPDYNETSEDYRVADVTTTPLDPYHSMTGTSVSARVAQIESELNTLERDLGAVAAASNPTVDRLRVELQFQRRLAERVQVRKFGTLTDTTAERLGSALDGYRPRATPEPTSIAVEPFDWKEKRETLPSENVIRNEMDRLSRMESERREMLARQERKSRERIDWFEQHEKRLSRENEIDRDGGHFGLDIHGRYGRPKFDPNQIEQVSIAPQFPIQSRLGPHIVEGEWNRIGTGGGSSSDSLRVKKSVSFDKNLERISVYSPPSTPLDSSAENTAAVPPTVEPKNTNGQKLTTDIPRNFGPIPPSHSTSSMKEASTRFVVDPSVAGPIPFKSNPVPNAELLSFKEKMQLFAKQIGDEPPKERSRISTREQLLLSNNRSAQPITQRPSSALPR